MKVLRSLTGGSGGGLDGTPPAAMLLMNQLFFLKSNTTLQTQLDGE